MLLHLTVLRLRALLPKICPKRFLKIWAIDVTPLSKEDCHANRNQTPFIVRIFVSHVSGSSPGLAKSFTQEVEDALNFYHYGKNGAIKFDLNTRWENVNQDNVLAVMASLPPCNQALPMLSPPAYASDFDTAISWAARICRISRLVGLGR